MMILPLADTLMNCLQNLTSRIAGVDNEQMTGRVMGMGAMLGYGIGAVKEQFNTPSANTKTGFSNSNNESSGEGFKGLISRTKSIINPSMNLSPEKDYNGNANPIRNVMPKESSNNKHDNFSTPTSNKESKNTLKNVTNVAGKVAKTGLSATKAYLKVGASLAEGNFDNNNLYKSNDYKKNNLKSTEYLNKVESDKLNVEKLGDNNEYKGKS